MNRPDVRVVEPQQEEIRDAQVSSWEAEQLMRKYGYQTDQETQHTNTHDGLTFEEMIAQEEARLRNERLAAQHKAGAPRPISFDGSGGYHSETRYGTDDDSGYGFKIQVTSDMPIPKY